MKKVIIVSLNFPPSQMAGVHRARHLAKHLPSFGWEPIILTVDERYHKETCDPELGRLVPRSVQVYRTKAIPLHMTRWLGLGDLSIRSFYQVARSLTKMNKQIKPDIIFITGAPYYQMMLAPSLSKAGAAVVLDFQDPWVSAFGATRAAWSKGGLAHRLAVMLEPRAVRAADFITSVSELQNNEMCARYPWLDPMRLAAVPIGGDPEDFQYLVREKNHNARVVFDSKLINLSYVGTYLPRAEPLVRLLFRALVRLRERAPALGSQIRLNFIGTSNQPNGPGVPRILPIARSEAVEELVVEIPERVPFREALKALLHSNGLLLIGSDEPHYTASKIYPALMSGRPFLSVFHAASSAHSILEASGGGLTHSFGSPTELSSLEPRLSENLHRLALAPESLGKADPRVYAEYEARAVAGKFAGIFDRVSAQAGNAGSSCRDVK